MIKRVFVFTAVLFFVSVNFNPSTAEVSSSNPLEISAAKSLEWDRVNKTYTANEEVVVTQGVMKIESNKLVAVYSDEKGVTDIAILQAEGDVVITSPPYVAYGDKAVYEVKSGNALLTGKMVTVVTDKDTMTTEDKVEFFGAEKKLVASGNPVVKHEMNVISAKSMTAYFKEDAKGKLLAEKIIAEGGVIVKTPKETAIGNKAVYEVRAQKATISGNVQIVQGKNTLEGTQANVDLATGKSEVLGMQGKGGKTRVKGVFYPSALKKNDDVKKDNIDNKEEQN